jgi:sensor histidine kinase YesM
VTGPLHSRRPQLIVIPRSGPVIVAIVATIHALRVSIKVIVSQPFADWSAYFLEALAYSAFIGCLILLAVVGAVRRVPRHGARQYVAVFAAVAVAAAAAELAVLSMETWFFGHEEWPAIFAEFALDFVPQWASYAVLGMLIASGWLYARAEAEQSEVLKQVALDSARLDQETAAARLQMLEAQIEPHFLFNTLAHVKRLYEVDRADGARMLQNLKAYLAVALPQMRETESTLARELAHVAAYLNIQQIRMGRRLAFGIDLPASLRDARMPSLMLLTLVENAIKHGLGPAKRGGRIDITASLAEGALRVRVADTGQGFVKSEGGGTGLANIRARLRAQFGNTANLSLKLNVPEGVIATIEIPYENVTSPNEAT